MFLSNKKHKIHDTHIIFATTKGSMNACMELVGFSTSDKVKNREVAYFWYVPLLRCAFNNGVLLNNFFIFFKHLNN